MPVMVADRFLEGRDTVFGVEIADGPRTTRKFPS